MILNETAAKIKAIVLDVDGVLTDGRLGYYGQEKGREIKFFHVRDGHGIKMAQRVGLKIGILSGRSAAANRFRAQELGMDFYYEGCLNKKDGFLKLLEEQGLKGEECMYIGDDVVDIPPMRLAGIGVAVADGVEELDRFATFRTRRNGGCGAVREAIDALLKAQGTYETVLERYYQ